MIETTILSSADVANILSAANTRKQNDTKYADSLLGMLISAARGANLKDRFWEAIYDRRPARFMLHQVNFMHTHGTVTYNVEDIINEYDVLEKLAKVCGSNVVAYYGVHGDNVNIYLEFKVPGDPAKPETPVESDLNQRRYEKETSW